MSEQRGAARVMERLLELRAVGADPRGGTSRFTYTPEHTEVLRRVGAWMEAAGLQVHRDAAGNLVGRWGPEGQPAVALGSHLDTVPSGGAFDGMLGVVGAIEVVEGLLRQGAPPRPLEIIAFAEEEGTRFGSLLGSRAMFGQLGQEVLEARDPAGARLGDALAAAGLDAARWPEAARDPREIAAYLELHIEQGAVLESLGLPVGVVTHIVGGSFGRLRLQGRADHAGATPMPLRHDAMAAAAEIVLAVERAAPTVSPSAVATVGHLTVAPGAVNVIAGCVDLTLDMRDIDNANVARLEKSIVRAAKEVGRRRGVAVDYQRHTHHLAVALHPALVETVARACRAAALPEHRMPSGAIHDAQVVAAAVPAGMVFVRSRQGISHAPEEWTDEQDVDAGLGVLRAAVAALLAGPPISCT